MMSKSISKTVWSILFIWLTNLLLAAVFMLSIGSVLAAQTKEENAQALVTQSSKGFVFHGGLVNVVDGEAECQCGGAGISVLRPKQELTSGDTIKVGAGRVEVLLNPGYYLRLAPHTEARLLDLTPGNLKIKLLAGSVIIEIAMDAFSGFRENVNRVLDIVTLITPRDEFAISQEGAYRLDIVSAEESRISVLKGRAVFAGASIDDGHAASVVSGHVDLAANQALVPDAFDTWSRERAAVLVRSNKSLKRLKWYKEMKNGKAYMDAAEEATTDVSMARTVSAQHGLIAFVENGSILKNGNVGWEALSAGGTLLDGDRLRTEIESRAEIRPYPDFYLFMNGNSEIQFGESQDGDVSIAVMKGSVVIVVAGAYLKPRDRNFLKLVAGSASFEISRRGYYHLNYAGGDIAEMLIYDGEVRWNGSEIGARKKLVVNGSNLTRSSLDKDNQNSFDVWSDRRVVRSLVGPLRRRLWSAGAWYLDPSSDEYTFVPGDRECKSPYGGEYSVTYRISRPQYRPFPSRQPINEIRSTNPVSRPRILRSPFLRN